MNDVVVPWCRAQKIEVTRSRAYEKNDQAFVEQKNGAAVRRLVGYGRFEGAEAAQAMAHLYAAARLYVNFFQPSFKLKEKRREGARGVGRLSERHPEQFGKKQHSIVQRLLKALRKKAAEKLIAEVAPGARTIVPLPGSVDGSGYEGPDPPPAPPVERIAARGKRSVNARLSTLAEPPG